MAAAGGGDDAGPPKDPLERERWAAAQVPEAELCPETRSLLSLANGFDKVAVMAWTQEPGFVENAKVREWTEEDLDLGDFDESSSSSDDDFFDDEDGDPGAAPSNMRLLSKETKEGTLPVRGRIDLQRVVRETDQHRMVSATPRRVLFVGRTRSGKTTARSVLKDPVAQPVAGSAVFSDTNQSAVAEHFAIRLPDDESGGVNRSVAVTVTDTPGLFERVAEGEEARSNEKIVETIARCLDNEFTKVNCVVMFASFHAGVNPDDIAAILRFTDLFSLEPESGSSAEDSSSASSSESENGKEADEVTMILCVTRAERMSPKDKKRIVSQLLEHPSLAQLIRANRMDIMFMGAVDPQTHSTPKSLVQQYKHVGRMRKKLLEKIFASKDFVSLRRLKVATAHSTDVKAALERMAARLKEFQVADFDALETKAEMEAQEKDGAFVDENSAFTRLADLSEASMVVIDAATTFNSLRVADVPRSVRRRLMHPYVIGTADELAQDQREEEALRLQNEGKQEEDAAEASVPVSAAEAAAARQEEEERRDNPGVSAATKCAVHAADRARARADDCARLARDAASAASLAQRQAEGGDAEPDRARFVAWERTASAWVALAMDWVVALRDFPQSMPPAATVVTEADANLAEARSAYSAASNRVVDLTEDATVEAIVPDEDTALDEKECQALLKELPQGE